MSWYFWALLRVMVGHNITFLAGRLDKIGVLTPNVHIAVNELRVADHTGLPW